jgi:hypothetical protein
MPLGSLLLAMSLHTLSSSFTVRRGRDVSFADHTCTNSFDIPLQTRVEKDDDGGGKEVAGSATKGRGDRQRMRTLK